MAADLRASVPLSRAMELGWGRHQPASPELGGGGRGREVGRLDGQLRFLSPYLSLLILEYKLLSVCRP